MKASSDQRKGNPVVNFLSSVRLAVILLIILAIASVAGTVIPQGEQAHLYEEMFGPFFSKIIQLLHLEDTYHSWWYLSLLGFFCLNLVVCTLKRLPFTLKLYRRDNLALGADRLLKMPYKKQWKIVRSPDSGEIDELVAAFQKSAGRVRVRAVDGGRLFLSEHGKWSYWGLYGLHASIIVIFVGALIGTFWGFKGSIMLMEGESTAFAADRKTMKNYPLGFSLRCDNFDVSFYDTGAPKEFRSDLTIVDNDKDVLSKSIVVNDPLSYKGFTFYQSSYQAVPEVTLDISGSESDPKTITVPAYKSVEWPEANRFMRLMQVSSFHGMPIARVAVFDARGTGRAMVLIKGKEVELKLDDKKYTLALTDAAQHYMTGLQVKKDPGVWVVYLGCAGLILGFVVVFWVPHRRMWLWVGTREGNTSVILSGQANKNRIRFEKDFESVANALDKRAGEIS